MSTTHDTRPLEAFCREGWLVENLGCVRPDEDGQSMLKVVDSSTQAD